MYGNKGSSFNGMYGDQQFVNAVDVRIAKMIFIPTKEYTDVYRRPFEMNTSANSLNALENVIGDQLMRGGNVNPLAIANVVPDIMKLSDVPKEKIQIANGWGTVRLRFIMEVEHMVGTATHVSYIQGYTDYHDPSISGKIDPNMLMHINSITNVIRTTSADTGQMHTRVHSSFNILYDSQSNGYNVENTTESHRLLRPKDIVDGMDMNKIQNAHDNNMDSRSLFGVLPQESKRTNSVGVQHITNVINGVVLGNDMASIGYGESDIMNVATSGLDENNLGGVTFIEALSAITGEVASVEFTLNDLAKLDPGVEQALVIVDTSTPMLNDNMINNILDTTNTAEMGTVSMEATIAATISESVTGLLVDDMLSSIDFSITNMTPNSEQVVAISSSKSFIHGIDVIGYTERFMNKFQALVMPAITKNNLMGVDIFIHADVLGETTIAVALNGDHPVVYRLPTFCNSLYTSMISQEGDYNVLVEDFSQVLAMTNLT